VRTIHVLQSTVSMRSSVPEDTICNINRESDDSVVRWVRHVDGTNTHVHAVAIIVMPMVTRNLQVIGTASVADILSCHFTLNLNLKEVVSSPVGQDLSGTSMR